MLDNRIIYYGGEINYEVFMSFVKEVLGPSMEMTFEEEEYYKIMWECHFFSNNKKRGVVLEIARGHSKTEFGIWVSIYCAIFSPINPLSKKPINQQLIISSDTTTTEEIRSRIIQYINDNKFLREFLPDNISDTEKTHKRWNCKVLKFKNNNKIHFRSVQIKRGLHVDKIWLDDPTTESSTLKDDETIRFFNTAILPMGGVKEAIIVITGTPLRITDILSVVGSNEKFEHIKLPCMNRDTKELLSKKRFTREILDEMRTIIGSVAFESEYMLNPINDASSIIKRNHIIACFDEDWVFDKKIYKERYVGVDFASSDMATADKTVVLDVGITKDKEIHIIYGYEEKGMSGLETMEKINMFHRTNNYNKVAIERNHVLSVMKEIKEIKLPLAIYHMGTSDVLKKGRDFTTLSKLNSIKRLATAFENKEIVIPYRTEQQKIIAHKILEECTSWATKDGVLKELGKHPDWPISLILCNEARITINPIFLFLNKKI